MSCRVAVVLLAAAALVVGEDAGWRVQIAAGRAVQPADPPRGWRFVLQPLPPVEAVAAQAPDAPPYGCYSWGGEYLRFRKDLREVGWTSWRLGGFIDEPAIIAALEDGVEVMHTLQIGESLEQLRSIGKRNAFPSDEAFIAAYLAVVERFCVRYGPGGSLQAERPALQGRAVRHLELWNEPNFQYMIADGPDMPALRKERDRLYAKVLREVGTAVKARHPQMRVLGFAAGGSAFDDRRFIANVHILDPGIGACYDILSTHPYHQSPPLAERVRSWGAYSPVGGWQAIRGILAAHGQAERPIWWSEVGWPIPAADGGQFADRPDELTHPAMLQAACVVKMYALALRLGVQRVHIMSAADADRFNSGFFDRRTGEWRPAAHAVRQMIRLLPRPRLIAAPHDDVTGTIAWRFASDGLRPDAPEVVMAWREGGPAELTVPLPAGRLVAEVRDLIGGEVPVRVADGAAVFAGGPLPCYVALR
jgi:hypothetical protein